MKSISILQHSGILVNLNKREPYFRALVLQQRVSSQRRTALLDKLDVLVPQNVFLVFSERQQQYGGEMKQWVPFGGLANKMSLRVTYCGHAAHETDLFAYHISVFLQKHRSAFVQTESDGTSERY